MTPPKVNPTKRAYQSTFFAPNGDTPDAQRRVLADLAKFCGAGRTPRSIGPAGIDLNATLMMVGRLEVWNHINALLSIPEHDIVRLAITPVDTTATTGDFNA